MKAVIIGLAALCVDIELNAMIVIDRLTGSELTTTTTTMQCRNVRPGLVGLNLSIYIGTIWRTT